MGVAENHAVEGLELLDVGVGMFGADGKLVFCNPAFLRLRRYPETTCRPGVSLEELLRFNAMRGDFGPGEVDVQVADRVRGLCQSNSA